MAADVKILEASANDMPEVRALFCEYRDWLAIDLCFQGFEEELATMVEQLLSEQASFTVAFARQKLFYLERPEQLQLYLDGLAKAGLPPN